MSVDTVHMRSMLDHVQVPDLAILEAHRVLKKNGQLTQIIGSEVVIKSIKSWAVVSFYCTYSEFNSSVLCSGFF